ncbi:hypothetical protein GCM10010232_17380 [Streptomyces amakusaensis]
MVFGGLVWLVGPLLAIACDSCQDGVRGSVRFIGTLTAIARYGVPLATLVTVLGIFTARRGGRAGFIGLAVLTVLLVLMLVLGRITG